MIDGRRQGYLDAMGIQVWSLRDQAITEVVNQQPSFPGLKLGPGTGGILLVCAADLDAASKLANDINRALGCVPVWAWPDTGSVAGVNLADAVEQHLFITVAIFGKALAAQIFGNTIPHDLHSSKVVVLPDMQDLESQAGARCSLWKVFCESGMVVNN